MKKDLGPKNLIYPQPVLIISTYDENNVPDAMTAAWGGISDTNEIHICLSKEHKTTKNILLKKEFVVSMGTKETVVACDYVGMISGNDETDKLEKVLWHTRKSEHIDAPIIDELRLALECQLISYDEESGHLYAKIINVVADEEILKEGKIDLDVYHPLLFDGDNHTYHTIGEKVGKAFEDYKKL